MRHRISKLENQIRILSILAVVLAMLALFFGCRYIDERDYRVHMEYAERNQCEWQWDELGNWTLCK